VAALDEGPDGAAGAARSLRRTWNAKSTSESALGLGDRRRDEGQGIPVGGVYRWWRTVVTPPWTAASETLR
jgi:hypothetical protein